jgi:hypothetical protein
MAPKRSELLAVASRVNQTALRRSKGRANNQHETAPATQLLLGRYFQEEKIFWPSAAHSDAVVTISFALCKIYSLPPFPLYQKRIPNYQPGAPATGNWYCPHPSKRNNFRSASSSVCPPSCGSSDKAEIGPCRN